MKGMTAQVIGVTNSIQRSSAVSDGTLSGIRVYTSFSGNKEFKEMAIDMIFP